MSRAAVVVLLSLSAAAAVMAGLAAGSVHIPFAKLLAALVQPGSDAKDKWSKDDNQISARLREIG